MLKVCFLITRVLMLKVCFCQGVFLDDKVCCVTHLPFSEGVLTKGVQVG